MNRLKLISISAIILLSLFAIQTVSAANIQYYFAVVYDDNSKSFFYSDIYKRDMYTYHADYNDWVEHVKRSHTFYCPGCYSATIVRGKTYDDAENKLQSYKRQFKSKGYSITYKSWVP